MDLTDAEYYEILLEMMDTLDEILENEDGPDDPLRKAA